MNWVTQAFQQIANAISQGGAAVRGNHELNLVKINPYHGRDDEDPVEWLESFEQAAAANQWPDNRKIEIAAGYLKDAAADWYRADRANINQWNQFNNANGSFYHRFIQHFSTMSRQNKWHHELHTLRQGSTDTVETYARQFKKLLKKVDPYNQTPPSYQIRIFLYGLNPILMPMITLANPQDLDSAIDFAKRAESGYQLNSMYLNPNIIANNLTNDAINRLTRQMEQISLNYAEISKAVSTSVEPIEQKEQRRSFRNRNTRGKFDKRNIECYNCGEKGHYARECLSERQTNGRNRTNRRAVKKMIIILVTKKKYTHSLRRQQILPSKAKIANLQEKVS